MSSLHSREVRTEEPPQPGEVFGLQFGQDAGGLLLGPGVQLGGVHHGSYDMPCVRGTRTPAANEQQ